MSMHAASYVHEVVYTITSRHDGAVPASPVTATRKRKVRGKHNDTAKDERKRQRRAAFFLASQGDTEAGT